MEHLLQVAMIGTGATLAGDIWGWVRRPLTGVAPPDYGMVGRWLGHLARGRMRHERIAAATPIRGERILGWSAHYLIGIAFAFLLVAVAGRDWPAHPSIGPALLIGTGTVLAPFLVMQPGMGAGFFASRAPRPGIARLHSVLLHVAFGLGLYLAALLASLAPGTRLVR